MCGERNNSLNFDTFLYFIKRCSFKKRKTIFFKKEEVKKKRKEKNKGKKIGRETQEVICEAEV